MQTVRFPELHEAEAELVAEVKQCFHLFPESSAKIKLRCRDVSGSSRVAAPHWLVCIRPETQ